MLARPYHPHAAFGTASLEGDAATARVRPSTDLHQPTKIDGDHDTPYRATRFKPVVKDPIAIFRNLIAPQPDGGEPHMPWAPEEPKKVPDKPLVISVPDRNCEVG